jgi:hypothetical protein
LLLVVQAVADLLVVQAVVQVATVRRSLVNQLAEGGFWNPHFR